MTYDATTRERANMHNDNRLKIGLFSANVSSGRTPTKVPERWSGSWDDNVRLAAIFLRGGVAPP